MVYCWVRKLQEGVHGAGFASKAIRNKGQMVPDSQVADPASGKILMDCIHEVNEEGLISGMQDIGAGGVLCAAAEMATGERKGWRFTWIRFRCSGRILMHWGFCFPRPRSRCCLQSVKEDLDKIREIAGRWELACTVIGAVSKEERIRILMDRWIFGDLPVHLLVRGGGAPVYIRDMKPGERPHGLSRPKRSPCPET